MPATAPMVPYRTNRPLRGCKCQPKSALQGLAGSSKKRNGDAFGAAYPGVNWVSDSQIILPAKFGGITVNRDGFDEIAGTWYGATYHPDGDQAGWQQKFDAALRKYGAYNAFYGISTQPAIVTTPPQVVTTVAPTPLPVPIPVPVITAPSPTPAPTPTPTPTPAPTTLPATSTSPAITVNVPATVPATDTSALIQQLMAQGASQQQAFTAALQSLAAQGVQATPQVQQQVAADVSAASQPSQAGVYALAVGAVALILIGIVGSKRKRR